LFGKNSVWFSPRLFELIVEKTEVIEMNEETSFVVCEDVVAAGPVLLRREYGNRYGSVPGLDDSELADPVELERRVYQQEFGPVLALPVKGNILTTQHVFAEPDNTAHILV